MIYILILIMSAVIGRILYIRQNKAGQLGGPICAAKAYWLYYTIITWFITLGFAITFAKDASQASRAVWISLFASMWIRGIIELIMLFKTKNWTPIIGISHDILTFFVMLAAWLYFNDGGTEDIIYSLFTASLFFSILVETHHAISFYLLMKGRTQGEDGLWYAHEEDPRFKRIIRVTLICNYILYALLLGFLLKIQFFTR